MNKNRFARVAIAAILTLPAFNNAFGGQDYPEPFGEFKWSDNWKTVAEKACALGNVTGIDCSDIEGSFKAIVEMEMSQSRKERFQSIGDYMIVRPVAPWYEIVVNQLQIGGIPYKLVITGGSITACSAEMIINNRTDEMLIVGDSNTQKTKFLEKAKTHCAKFPSPKKEQCYERAVKKIGDRFAGQSGTYYGYPIFDSFVLQVAESNVSADELKAVEKVFRDKYGSSPLFVDATLDTPWGGRMRNLFLKKSADITTKDFYEDGPSNTAAINLKLSSGTITYIPEKMASQRCSSSSIAELKNRSRDTSGLRDSSSSL